MGEKIEFPLNNQMYFEQAIKFLEKQEYEKALHCLKKVYQTDKSSQVNHLYTVILYTLDRAEEALDIANDQKEFYMKSENDAVFYTMILIKNHLFLEAEVLIQNHLSNSQSPYIEEWQNANRELVLERENVQFQIELKNKETIKELNEIESYTRIEQIEIIHNARQLSLSDLQLVADNLLINPQLLPTTQKAFLELLIEKDDANTYLFQWIEGPKQIIPKQLKTFEELDILKRLSETLESKLEKNPSFIEIIQTEIINDLLVLYPFVEEVVTDIDFWIDSYLEIFELTQSNPQANQSLSQDENQMRKWLKFLNQMAQRNTE